MSLEVLIGGKIFIFIWLPHLNPDLTFNNCSFLQMFLIGTTTWRLPGIAWWKLRVMVTPEASRLLLQWS
jgi:hypothetical protein